MHLSLLAWRGLAARRLRTALLIVGVALGVAVVTAALVTNQAASESVERAAEQLLGRAQLRVRAFADDGLSPRALSSLRRLSGVEAAAPVAQRRLTVSTLPGPDEAVFSMLAVGVDPADEPSVRTYPLLEGSGLTPTGADRVLVNAFWAREQGLGVGDQLLLDGAEPGTPPLRIVGLLDDAGFGALSGGAVLVMPRALLDDAFEIPAPVRYVDLVVQRGQTSAIAAQLDSVVTEPFVLETVADAAHQLGSAQASFSAIAFLFGLVALLVGTFLVGNGLALSVGERTREVGLLRAAGATSRQMLGIFLRQGVAIGLAGSIGGVLAGIVLAALVIALLRSTHTLLIGGLPLEPGSLGVAFALGTAVTLLGTALPAWQASRVAPLDALRVSRQPDRSLWGRLRWLVAAALAVVLLGVALPFDGVGAAPGLAAAALLLLGGAVAAAFLIVPMARLIGRPFEWFFGAEGMLGRANLGRDRARSGLTAGSLMIALAAVVALAAVAASAQAGTERWVASILPGGYAVRLALPVEIEQFSDTFSSTTGAAAAAPIAEFPAVLRNGERQRDVSLAGIDPALYERAGALIFVAGGRDAAFQALRNGGAVLIPEELSRRDGLEPGDTVALGRPGGAPQPFTVAGVVAYSLPGRAGDASLLVALRDARQTFRVSTATLWSLIPQPGIGAGAFRDAVEQTAMSLAGEVVSAPQLADELSRALTRFVGLFDALALVAVLIGALGIVNTLSAGVLQRLREIAVLRAHGMTLGQVQAMVVAEASIMGSIAGLLAAIIGLGVAWTVVRVAAPLQFAAGLTVPWPVLVSTVLLGTGVAALAGLYPARLAARQPLIASFRQFE